MFIFTKKNMKNKKIFLGVGILAVATITYFFVKKRKDIKDAENISLDDSDLTDKDIDYLSADGLGRRINIKKYLDFLKSTPVSDSDIEILNGKRIYSLFDKLNLRNEPSLSKEFIMGVVPKKYTYLGRISGISSDKKGDLWFEITPTNSNFKLKNNFNWGKGKFNPFRRYVKATAVFAESEKFVITKNQIANG